MELVNKFVEFHGPVELSLSLADRATISNMAPEYGVTCGFFPIDNETIKYLKKYWKRSKSLLHWLKFMLRNKGFGMITIVISNKKII